MGEKFIGFEECPVCKEKTRHYYKDAYESKKMYALKMKYCDNCKVVRVEQ